MFGSGGSVTRSFGPPTRLSLRVEGLSEFKTGPMALDQALDVCLSPRRNK
jgi:hypothetical protein